MKTIERADGEQPWDEIGLAKKALKYDIVEYNEKKKVVEYNNENTRGFFRHM